MHQWRIRMCTIDTTLFLSLSSLFVKKAIKKGKARESILKDKPEEFVPPNLRRKFYVSRQPMGHIVPKSIKVKGSGGNSNPRLRPQGKEREEGMNNPSRIRISAGTARGRRLDSPDVYLRPMMGKVREAVFSALTSFGLYDRHNRHMTRHLDVFAGSGSVGLESLSRGADHCTFVDLSQDCCSAIRRNIKWCQFTDPKQSKVICGDAIKAFREPATLGIPTDRRYSLVTLCPPYEEVVYSDLLEAVVDSPLVGQDTIVMVEYPKELLTHMPPVIQGKKTWNKLIGCRNRRYGRTIIGMYIINPTGIIEGADPRPEEFVPQV